MNEQKEFYDKSMDEIVFDNRNKSYGAYFLRDTYKKHLTKALVISIGAFVFGLYTPKMGKALGLFAEKPPEILDSTNVVLAPPPPLKEDAPPPPPPPPAPPLERPTERFLEMKAVEKEKAEDPPPTVEEMENKEIGDKKIEGTVSDVPQIVEEVTGGGDVVEDNNVYVNVDQKAEFKGLNDFISANIVYPEAEKSDGITGETIVSFVVTKEGKVTDVKVFRGSGNKRLDAEAVKVIEKTSGKFKAAKINGKPVKQLCQIPISFELEEE